MMSYKDSQILKGVAILLMLFYHLFYRLDFALLCDNYIVINDAPLVNIIAKICNPVAFFLIISGYGSYLNKNKGIRPILTKAKYLYVLYWATLALFVPIGYFVIGSERYPGSIVDIIFNITGIQTSYNGEVWFLLPYIILMLTRNKIFSIVDKAHWIIMIISSLIISTAAAWCTPRIGFLPTFITPFIKTLFYYCNLLPAFIIGGYIAKYHIIERTRQWIMLHKASGVKLISKYHLPPPIVILTLAIISIAIRLLDIIPFFHLVFAAVISISIVVANKPNFVYQILAELGKRSTLMWFTHSYFCYHIFKSCTYSLQYPLVIFIAVMAVSYLTALAIEYLLHQTHLIDSK